MKPAAQARIVYAVVFAFIGMLSLTAKPKKKNPVLERLREAYQDVLEGNENDLKYNKRRLVYFENKLKEIKRSPKSDKAKQAHYVQGYTTLIDLYTRLVAANEAIIGMFEGTSKPTKVELAMEEIPKLEASISKLTKKESKREWLTFGEVQQLRRKGMVFETPNAKRLPYLKKYWREPTEAEIKKRESDKRKRTHTNKTDE